MAEQSITLEPSESKQVNFEAVPSVAKTYQVSVDGLEGSFKATEAEELATADVTAWGYNGGPFELSGVLVEVIGVGSCITKTGYGGNFEPSSGCFIENIPPGTHNVRMSISGYKTATLAVTFKPGEMRTFFFRLYKA